MSVHLVFHEETILCSNLKEKELSFDS